MSVIVNDAFKRILFALGPAQWRVTHKPFNYWKERPRTKTVIRDRLLGLTKFNKKEVTIYKHLDAADALGTILHELLHVAYPKASERAIHELSSKILAELWGIK